jgi:hypothetical protein
LPDAFGPCTDPVKKGAERQSHQTAHRTVRMAMQTTRN